MKKQTSCHRDFFHQHQLKNTPIRDVVMHQLEAHQPLTLERLYGYVKETAIGNKTSHSTVFRIVEQFLAVGIIEKITLETETTPLYQLQHNHHHHQLVCTKCKTIITLHECPLQGLEKQIAKAHQFKADHHQFTLYGLCQDCQ
jgi:Fur family transcriptional regulator, ferric uptake regulator